MAIFRIVLLTGLLVGAIWSSFISAYPVSAQYQQVSDAFDERPTKRVLMIGNSRSFSNDMPQMIRQIADADAAPYKLQIVEHLIPGENLKGHWNNARVHALLEAEQWDEVIIQAQSAAHYDRMRANFREFGAKLANKAKRHSKAVRLLVAWPYDEPIFDPTRRKLYHERIQADHESLARTTSTLTTDVGAIWEANRGQAFDFALTTDGNHPTVQGSFITALALYTDMKSQGPVQMGYTPSGVSAAQHKGIVERVAFHWQLHGDL